MKKCQLTLTAGSLKMVQPMEVDVDGEHCLVSDFQQPSEFPQRPQFYIDSNMGEGAYSSSDQQLNHHQQFTATVMGHSGHHIFTITKHEAPVTHFGQRERGSLEMSSSNSQQVETSSMQKSQSYPVSVDQYGEKSYSSITNSMTKRE